MIKKKFVTIKGFPKDLKWPVKDKGLIETPAKGKRGFILFIGAIHDPDVYFRVYGKKKKPGLCPDFVDYRISNHDFRFKVLDKRAVFRGGGRKGKVLDLDSGVMGRKYKDESSAYGKELMAHLLIGYSRGGPQVVLKEGKDWKSDKWFRLTHPDLEIEIVDGSAALFRDPKDPDESFLDYTTTSMMPATSYRAGKLSWVSKEAIRKGWVSKEELAELKKNCQAQDAKWKDDRARRLERELGLRKR